MKKLLSVICMVVLAGTFAKAQDVSFGARGGLNFANISEKASNGATAGSYSMRTSILLGGYATIMFNDNMGLQPELFYSGYGAKESNPAGDITLKLGYLSLPVFFRYNFNEQWHLLAGPQLGILMSAKAVQGGNSQDVKSNVNSSDFGLTVGVGADFDKINVGVRYNAGFSNLSKSSNFTDKNNAFQLVVGYKLFGGK